MATARPPAALVLVSLLAIVLVACGGAPAGERFSRDTSAPAAAPTAAPAAKPAAPAAAAPARPAESAADAAKVSGGAGAAAGAPKPAATAPAPPGKVAGAAGNIVPPLDQRIIRTGRIDLVVPELREAMRALTAIVRAVGGYIQQSSTSEQGNVVVAQATLRVPVEQYDDVFQQLRDLAVPDKRPIESSDSQDVTEEFADVTARINNLKITEGQVQKLLARAEKMEDILILQRELTELRTQIERLQGRLNVLDRRSAFSTITVTMRPHLEAERVPPPAPVLRLPARGATDIGERPTFTWLPSAGAQTYDLQVTTETDTTFATPVLVADKLTTNTYEWPADQEPLRLGTTYIWRVRGVNAAGAGEWARPSGFTTVPPWSPLRVMGESWAASLRFLRGVIDAVLSVVVFFWWLILPLVVALPALRRRGLPFRRSRPTPPAPPAEAPPGDERAA